MSDIKEYPQLDRPQQVFNQVCITGIDGIGANPPDSITVRCPFIPDEVLIQGFINLQEAAATNDLAPILIEQVVGAPDTNLMSSYFYLIDVPDFPVDGDETIALCNANNTANPVFRYWNTNRNEFRSEFDVRVRPVSDLADNMTRGIVILKIEYRRYL